VNLPPWIFYIVYRFWTSRCRWFSLHIHILFRYNVCRCIITLGTWLCVVRGRGFFYILRRLCERKKVFLWPRMTDVHRILIPLGHLVFYEGGDELVGGSDKWCLKAVSISSAIGAFLWALHPKKVPQTISNSNNYKKEGVYKLLSYEMLALEIWEYSSCEWFIHIW
jgi:hypothetical protein